MSRSDVTCGQLDQLLRALGFDVGKRTESSQAYYHGESQTLILLPPVDPSTALRPADLMSVRLRLLKNGFLEETVLGDFLEDGTLPIAS